MEFEFDPAKKTKLRRPLFSAMIFKENGRTAAPTWIWSGERLMDLTWYQVLRMEMKTLDDSEYLFIEAGGFSTRNKPGWKPMLYVMKRM